MVDGYTIYVISYTLYVDTLSLHLTDTIHTYNL
jgi:hypothetical protein